MDKNQAISALKQLVQDDISYLCRRADLIWNAPIVHTMRDLRDCGGKSVFFGGAVRSLLFSRLLKGRLGRPRDVDIVVNETTIDGLRERFGNLISRETRFGGLQLLRGPWQFDIWPLQQTWAFVKDNFENPTFANLPSTTFFNLEAVAIEVWPTPGASRVIFSGEEQFFDGVLSRTLELNREENPFPTLCVIRALVLASGMDLAIGPKLAKYLAQHAGEISDGDLRTIQLKHYGSIRVIPEIARSLLNHIAKYADHFNGMRMELPLLRQSTFWPKGRDIWPMLAGIMDAAHVQDKFLERESNHDESE
jgi:hypothetical protein